MERCLRKKIPLTIFFSAIQYAALFEAIGYQEYAVRIKKRILERIRPSSPVLVSQESLNPLFRSQVLEEQSSEWLGALRVSQPLSATVIAVSSAILGIMLIAFLMYGSYVKRARVAGITVPEGGSLSVVSPSSGTLIGSIAEEGQEVAAGQPLFELSTERRSSSGDIAALVANHIATRKDSLDSEKRTRSTQFLEKKRTIAARVKNLDAELVQLEHEWRLAERRQALAESTAKKFETLEKSGYVSAVQTQQKHEDVLDLAARLASLSRAKVQLAANRLALEAELYDLGKGFSAELAQIDRAVAGLAQEALENDSKKSAFVVAPKSGVFATIAVQPGQSVVAGQALGTVISRRPNGVSELEVHLYAPSRTAGFVSAGQQVQIRYQAFPYQKFGLFQGTVKDVSRTPFAPTELPPNLASTILSTAQQSSTNYNGNEALYRIKVRLEKQAVEAYGHFQPLKPGMTLDADILQENRKLWEWIAEPLFSFTRR